MTFFLPIVLAGALQSAAAPAVALVRRPLPQLRRTSCPLALAAAPLAPAPSYVPDRVFDTKSRAFVDFEVMLATVSKRRRDLRRRAARRSQHAPSRSRDPRRPRPPQRRPIVSLEMFERDVQPALDSYLSGRTPKRSCSRPRAPGRGTRPTTVRSSKQRSNADGPSLPRTCHVVSPQRCRSPARRPSASCQKPTVVTSRATSNARGMRYFDRFAATMTGHPGADSIG